MLPQAILEYTKKIKRRLRVTIKLLISLCPLHKHHLKILDMQNSEIVFNFRKGLRLGGILLEDGFWTTPSLLTQKQPHIRNFQKT